MCASKAASRCSDQNIYDPQVELVQVRKQIGMVFQRPNPLPISIRDNILFGHRLHNKDRRYSRSDEDDRSWKRR